LQEDDRDHQQADDEEDDDAGRDEHGWPGEGQGVERESEGVVDHDANPLALRRSAPDGAGVA
jgi:hypothetical protein